MNNQQAISVLNQAKNFESINFDEFLANVYPGRTDLENIELTQMNLSEFLYLSKRVFQQFITEFEDRNHSLVLPISFTQPQIGNAQLDTQLQSYINYILSNNVSAAENILIWLVAYQVEHGFYNKISRRSNEATIANINKLTEKLNLIQINLTIKQREVETQLNELEISKKEIQNLIIQKRDELAQISSNLTTSNSQTNQINELLTNGTNQSSRLTTLLEQQELNKVIADRKLLELQDLLSTTNEKLSENLKTVLAQIDIFNNQVDTNEGHLKFIEGKREFFDDRIKYLEDLIGREVGASLFETFKQRKTELTKPVLFWRWAVPVMSFATVGWIFFLFSHQPEITDIYLWWQAFAVNSLKTIPAIFLLLFSINQYRKERNFQEEYAFKSAVALTIKAYANQLADSKNKDSLIMQAVLSIYKTPIEDKHGAKFKSRTAMETLKSMVDTTHDLVKGVKS